MNSTLALTKKGNPQKPEESDEDYQDRMVKEAYWKLEAKKKRSKKEEEEFQTLNEKYIACQITRNGALSFSIADSDLRASAKRQYKELSSEHGEMTPLKRLLIDRLVSAWSLAASYERLFQISKYRTEQDGIETKISYTPNKQTTMLMKETLRGIEVANDQIIRLSQALRNLSAPPIHIKAKNAIVAQNLQVNQNTPSPKHIEETPCRTV